MLSPAETDALACMGKLKFICCLTKEQFFQLCDWVDGMGDETKLRLFETACCPTADVQTPSPNTPNTATCPPDAVDILCSHLDQEWLEAAAALGVIIELNVESGPLAFIGGVVSAAATAATALCFDKKVTDMTKTAICTVLTYSQHLMKMAQPYPLAVKVLEKLIGDPAVLKVLAECCALQKV